MARFRLKEGEQLIEKARVRDMRGESRDAYELVLTNQRVAVTRTHLSPMVFLFGLFGGLLGAAFSDTRLEYQILRERFASATATDPKELSVYSTGEGYAVTYFDLKVKNAAAWAERLQRWATTTPDADMPRATVVKRD